VSTNSSGQQLIEVLSNYNPIPPSTLLLDYPGMVALYDGMVAIQSDVLANTDARPAV
jgi:hypothetical protein